MPDITFNCPYCSKSLVIDARGAGLIVQCPDCGNTIKVPQPNSTRAPRIENPQQIGKSDISSLRHTNVANANFLRTFNVYNHPTKGIQAVKVGFSWPALFFGIFWMIIKQLWGWVSAWFAMIIALGVISSGVEIAESLHVKRGEGDALALLLINLLLSAGYLALWLIPAFQGNKWREYNLMKRGYELIATVQAKTPDAAVASAIKASHNRRS